MENCKSIKQQREGLLIQKRMFGKNECQKLLQLCILQKSVKLFEMKLSFQK